jgi:hypothetical protein
MTGIAATLAAGRSRKPSLVTFGSRWGLRLGAAGQAEKSTRLTKSSSALTKEPIARHAA